MDGVFEIHGGQKVFTLDEARAILPVVRRITKSAYEKVEALAARLSGNRNTEADKAIELELQHAFSEWQRKVEGLGGQAKGMWLVDFDRGDGYLCWRFPEPDIEFFHDYSQGFRGRVPLAPQSTPCQHP